MMPAYVCMHPTNVKYDGVTKQGPDVAHQTTYYIGCVWILVKRLPGRIWVQSPGWGAFRSWTKGKLRRNAR